jgi:glycolate oxidase
MKIIQQLLTQLPKNIILTGEENTRPFECDGLSVYRQKPLAVVLPQSVEQIDGSGA